MRARESIIHDAHNSMSMQQPNTDVYVQLKGKRCMCAKVNNNIAYRKLLRIQLIPRSEHSSYKRSLGCFLRGRIKVSLHTPFFPSSSSIIPHRQYSRMHLLTCTLAHNRSAILAGINVLHVSVAIETTYLSRQQETKKQLAARVSLSFLLSREKNRM